MQARISMVVLAVRDLAAAVAFYRDGLGLPLAQTPPGVAFFNLRGTWLGLAERGALAREIGISPEGEGYAGFNLAHNVASPAAVDALVLQAANAGATVVKPPQKADWGGYSAYFKDPDGHLWEIAHNPFLQIGPADAD